MKLLDSILSKGLDIWVILEIFVLNLAWMLALTLPMSCLIASLMAYGRLAGDNEITAAKASGISAVRFLKPAVIVAVLMCVGLVAFNNYVLPEANFRAAGLRSDIARKRAPALLSPATLIKDFPNYRIWIDSIDYKTDSLFGVKIYYWEGRQPPRYMVSHRATLKFSEDGRWIYITLFDGENHIVDEEDSNKYLRLRFKSQQLSIENVDASLYRRERSIRSDREMSIKQMYDIVKESRQNASDIHKEYTQSLLKNFTRFDSLSRAEWDSVQIAETDRVQEIPWYKQFPISLLNYRQLESESREMAYLADRFHSRYDSELQQQNKYLVEIHKKFSIPVACIVFVLIGGPLGMMARRGGLGMASILCMGPFLIYWIFFLRGEALADRLIISPWVSMWAPNILVGLISIYLVWKLNRMRK